MAESMSSEELQQLIAGYVLYDLSPEEAATLEQLMATNPAIAQEVDRLQQSLELAYAPEAVQPPDHLRAAVLNAAAATTQPAQAAAGLSVVPPASATSSQPGRRRGWLTGLGAVAALLILGLGISNIMLWRALQATRNQMQAADVLTVSLEPAAGSSAEAATAMVRLDLDNLEATLDVDNLPPLPEGQVYVLWTVLQPNAPFTTDDKNAILTEVFTAENQGDGGVAISLPGVYRDLDWIKAIAITVEAADSPQQHRSSPILIEML
jgi:anti-sigma-K factor RskA